MHVALITHTRCYNLNLSEFQQSMSILIATKSSSHVFALNSQFPDVVRSGQKGNLEHNENSEMVYMLFLFYNITIKSRKKF